MIRPAAGRDRLSRNAGRARRKPAIETTEATGLARSAGSRPRPDRRLGVERILGRVRKPGRYAGGECNSVQKDWSADRHSSGVFAYPDLYEIGMSNLGLRILYEVLNDRPDLLAERCFAPDVDLETEVRAAGVPLWSLETRRSLRDFDVVGLSLGFELVSTNLLSMLDLGGIGLTTAERTNEDPLVIAGGSIVLNPEPFADFLDAVVLGEGEDVILEISDALRSIGWSRRRRRTGGPEEEWRRGVDRSAALRALAAIPGVYVPSLYRPRYLDRRPVRWPGRLDAAALRRSIAGRIAADFETKVHGIRQLVAEYRHRLRPRPDRGDARLHARLPVLPGRHAVEAAARTKPGSRVAAAEAILPRPAARRSA